MFESVDAYAHIGLPRFITVEQFVKVMDRHGVQRAIVAAADTCPDLHEVSRAIVEYPERFRAVGVPLGSTFDEIAISLRNQARSGFIGIRIFDRMIVEMPGLLKVMGELNLVPYVVGGPGLSPAARQLAAFLEGGADRLVVAPHFAGAASPAVLEVPGPVRDLFDHPRLLVIFSRHGANDTQVIGDWARALIGRLGWSRILFGSEFPVCLWRNESYASTLEWVKTLEQPVDEALFYGGNALRSLWNWPAGSPRRIGKTHRPTGGLVNLFNRQGLEIPEEVHQRLLARFLVDNPDGLDYRAFITRILVEAGQ